MIRTLFFVFLCLGSISVSGQVIADSVTIEHDTLIVESGPDTVLINSYAKRYNPRKALLYAAILPGLGQAYNKKYWKLPLVYGGFVSLGNAISYYEGLHKNYKKELFDILSGKNKNPLHPEQSLRTAIDRARRERDFFIILMGGMYLLQMIDAHVDAHLKEFDLNPRLQVNIQPTSETSVLTGRLTGISLTIKF